MRAVQNVIHEGHGTPEAKLSMHDEIETPESEETIARKKRWKKHFLNSTAMRERVGGAHLSKFKFWLKCGTHPDYERWLHGSPDDKKQPIVPPKDIDKWIYCSPRRYLEGELGGPPIKRAKNSTFVRETFTP